LALLIVSGEKVRRNAAMTWKRILDSIRRPAGGWASDLS
jgi:hypothetical protein